MTSLIALQRRRGTVLLVVVGVILLLVLCVREFQLTMGAAPVVDVTAYPQTSFTAFDAPLPQGLALMFWVTLILLLGVVWSRALWGASGLSEMYLAGALIGTAGFPLLYVFTSLSFAGLANVQGMPRIVVEGHYEAYALCALFLLLLLGLLFLISREVVRAARKPL